VNRCSKLLGIGKAQPETFLEVKDFIKSEEKEARK
jgi:hypothetical protein